MKNINFSLFFKANMFLTICLFIPFMVFNNAYTVYELLAVLLASISSAIILYILIYILTFLFSFRNNIILYLLAPLFVGINIGLILDFFIYRLYKFHINAMVLNILTSPDAADSIQIGIFPIIVFILVILSFVVFEILLIKKLFKTEDDSKKLLNKKLNKTIILPIFIIIIIEKFSYGYAALFNNNSLVTKFKVIPLYQPLTFNRIAYKYFGIKPDVEVKNSIKLDGQVIYPLKELKFTDNFNKINIFIIASDSVQNAVVNSQITPNIEIFKKDSIVFNNHYSGGNATRFGIFSLMYGLNSTYWFSFLNNSKGSVLFDVLKQLNYNINIISSTNTSWPEFRKTAYVNVLDSIKDDFDGAPWQKDKQSSKYLIDKINNIKEDKPEFSFLFMDAPHGYSFPSDFNKFNAKDSNINYLTVSKDGKDVKSLFSRYKNSVAYNDKLFGDIIKALKEKGLYDNSLIIYTSDHGQEFYEYGNFGHNNAFSKAQINVPLIIKLPKQFQDKNLSTKIKNILTSHVDIVPTILSVLGVKNNPSDYSNGENLLNKNYKKEYVFSANWNNNAIITKEKTYIFSNLPNKMFKNEIRDTNTYKIIKNEKVNSKLVLDIMNENRRFLK